MFKMTVRGRNIYLVTHSTTHLEIKLRSQDMRKDSSIPLELDRTQRSCFFFPFFSSHRTLFAQSVLKYKWKTFDGIKKMQQLTLNNTKSIHNKIGNWWNTLQVTKSLRAMPLINMHCFCFLCIKICDATTTWRNQCVYAFKWIYDLRTNDIPFCDTVLLAKRKEKKEWNIYQ